MGNRRDKLELELVSDAHKAAHIQAVGDGHAEFGAHGDAEVESLRKTNALFDGAALSA